MISGVFCMSLVIVTNVKEPDSELRLEVASPWLILLNNR